MRTANAESETEKLASPAGAVPIDTALVLELLAAQLRAGLAPLAALGTLAEALNSRPLHTVCQRLQMGSGWECLVRLRRETFGELRDALAPRLHGWCTQHGAAALPLMRTASASAVQERAAESSVALVVPLGLCSLPAFISLGIVPILIRYCPR